LLKPEARQLSQVWGEKLYGVPKTTLLRRLSKGLSLEQALTKANQQGG
jgi:hypothetical protein